MLKNGWMYFDPSKDSVLIKVQKIKKLYEDKFHKTPNFCEASNLDLESSFTVDGVTVMPTKMLIKSNFYIGIEDEI